MLLFQEQAHEIDKATKETEEIAKYIIHVLIRGITMQHADKNKTTCT